MTDAAGTRTFGYGSKLELSSETLNGRTLNYTYSANGVKGRYIGLTGNHTYGYDAYGRLNQVNDHSFTRAANSDFLGTVTRPNNVNTAWSYEANRDLVSGVTDGAISALGYTNDTLGNRTSVNRTGSVFATSDVLTYGYNDRSEVISAASNNNAGYNYTYTYAYDPIGNRVASNNGVLSFSYTSNSLNQYTAINTAIPAYDFDGNLTSYDGWTYTWNGENQLVKAEKNGVKLEFSYDYMGRRIFKKVYDSNTLTKHLTFVYDGYKLIEESDALNGNAVVRKFAWQPDELGYDVPLTVYDAAENATYFSHTDANKNVTELTDSSGNVVAHYEYSPFGQLVKVEGTYAEENPFRFSSEYFDAETSLIYYNYRYYSPGLGRWTSRDPIEEKGGYSLYNFVYNSSVNHSDFLGLDTFLLDRELNPNRKTTRNPTDSMISHTFVYTTNKDGSLKNTYSWGNDFENGKGMWFKNKSEDVSAAKQAIETQKALDKSALIRAFLADSDSMGPTGRRYGNDSLDGFVDAEFNKIQNDDSQKHGWSLWNNCKHEAQNLISKAKKAQIDTKK